MQRPSVWRLTRPLRRVLRCARISSLRLFGPLCALLLCQGCAGSLVWSNPLQDGKPVGTSSQASCSVPPRLQTVGNAQLLADWATFQSILPSQGYVEYPPLK